MSYAIVCEARSGENLGIEYLGLVDRKITRKIWWTSDNPELLMEFRKKSAAEFALQRLRYNNPEIVSYESARLMLEEQNREILDNEATADMELGWDEHKH